MAISQRGAASAAPPTPAIVDETTLPAFRGSYLTVDQTLAALAKHGSILVNVMPGVGKSALADDLLDTAALYNDTLVIYLAPTHEIIDERRVVRGLGKVPIKHVVLRSRPEALCGAARNAQWRLLERNGNAALAKASICAVCPHALSGHCTWLAQLSPANLADVRLLVAAEAYVTVIRDFIPLAQAMTGAERVLVIFDEARFSNASYAVSIAPEELRAYYRAVEVASEIPDELRADYLFRLECLASASERSLVRPDWSFPAAINRYAAQIQAAGTAADPAFRYLGYALAQVGSNGEADRWRDRQGNIRFVARPFLDVPKLILGANLHPLYLRHRLGTGDIVPIFDGVRFMHSGTRALNIVSGLGAKCNLGGNIRRIAHFYAVKIHQNILAGRRTLLVASKSWVKRFAVEIERAMAELWMDDVVVPIDEFERHDLTDCKLVPLISYGKIGTNRFEDYDSAFALNGFYCDPKDLSERMQEAEPDRYRAAISIGTDARGYRHVTLDEPQHAYSGLDKLGDVYLAQLEMDTVVQAMSRVRFFTKPREVIFMQLADLRDIVPGIVEVRNLDEARQHLAVPLFKTYQAAVGAMKLRELMQNGVRREEAAASLGVSLSTARGWLRVSNSHHED